MSSYRSLLTELDSVYAEKNDIRLIESLSDHLLDSLINYFDLVDKALPQDEAEEVKKQFYSTVRRKDKRKFNKMIKELKVKYNG